MYVPSWQGISPSLLLSPKSPDARPFPFDAPHRLYGYLARGLIYQLVKAMDLAPGQKILVPSYHHGNEVRAIRAAGARIEFFSIDRDLDFDLDEIRRKATPDCRAILVIHYIGWPEPLAELRALASERGIRLIEDCALSLLAEHEGRPVGALGDDAIFCLYKTLPVPNGASLIQNSNPFERLSRLVFRPCGLASVSGRSLELMLEPLQTRAEPLAKGLRFLKESIGSALSSIEVDRVPVGDASFDPALADLAMSPLSEYILARVDLEAIPRLRRRNYARLAARFQGRMTWLDRGLPDGACPLFFPLLVRDKHRAVEALRARGIGAVEFWNTGDPAAEPAADVRFLRQHVIELPIHQDLTLEQIDYVADQVFELNLELEPRPLYVAGGAHLDPSSPPEATANSHRPKPPPRPEMVVDILRGKREIIGPLSKEWSALCDEGPSDALFFRPEWIEAYLRAFEPDAKLMLFTARDRGRLRAVLPLVEERVRFHGLPVRRLRAPANIHSCRADIVHGAGDFAEAARALWEHLKAIEGWDLIEIRDVPQAGATDQILGLAEGDGWPIGKWMSMRTPYIPLAGRHSAKEAIEAVTTPKFRSNLRRLKKKLESLGSIELRRIEQADPSTLEAFYALERAGWKGQEGSAIDCNPSTRMFYDEIARVAARLGRLSIYVLEHNGRPVAIQYGITSRDRYFLPKPAFDESLREYAPGKLLVERVVEDCVARGLVEFDFLGDWMPWKGDWTTHVRKHWFCYVFRKSLYGSILHAAKFSVGPLLKETSARLHSGNSEGERPAAENLRAPESPRVI